jgi:hypothetical protein
MPITVLFVKGKRSFISLNSLNIFPPLSGIVRDRKGSREPTGTERTGEFSQVVGFIREDPPFHAGDRGSNPLGDAKKTP